MNINEITQFALLGLGTGAIYALLGHGIVVIYRGSGTVNFAHGAMAMLGAFVRWELHSERGWPFAAALVVAMLFVALVGAALQKLVMGPLRNASPLPRLVATLGLLSVLTAGATLQWGSEQQLVESFLPRDPWHVGVFGLDFIILSDRIYLLVIAVALTGGLAFFYSRSQFGRSVSAVAENEQVAAMLGIAPERIAVSNWAIGGALAALAGILVVPISGLQVDQLTFLVIPALAAALAGRFRSFPIVLASGLLIGVLQSEMARYGSDLFGTTGQQGVAASLPFALIIVVLVVRGSALPLRSHVFDRLPSLGNGHLRILPLAAIAGVISIGSFTIFGTDLINALLAVVLAAIIILSLVVLTGYAGQVSLGQFALAGMGAFAAGRLVASEHWPFELALPAGVLTASTVGLLFAIPALRTRGINLAVMTLGLGFALQQILFANASYTGGINGTTVGETKIFGVNIDGTHYPERYLVFSLFCLALVVVLVSNIRRGSAGRRMIAVRTNERAAASLGVSVFGTKLMAFVLSAGIAGFGGILLAFQNRSIVYLGFGPFESINAMLQTVIGGVGHILGALVGAQFAPGSLASLGLDRVFVDPGQWLILGGGIAILITLTRSPNGIAAGSRRGTQSPALSGGLVDASSGREARPVRAMTLSVRELSVRIGGSVVVQSIDLIVEPAMVVGLVGPNGAGKTVCLDAITGFLRPGTGEIRFGDAIVNAWSVTRRARAGVARSFQSLELFDGISIEENIRTACEQGDARSNLRDLLWPRRKPLTAGALAAIRVFGLESDLDRRPEELSFGKRRLVAVARAVATEPSILLLDEPAAGLSTAETAELSELIRHLACEWGIGVLLVEHDMSMISDVCDRVIVMESGAVIAAGTPSSIRSDPQVIEAYLGSSGSTDRHDVSAVKGQVTT